MKRWGGSCPYKIFLITVLCNLDNFLDVTFIKARQRTDPGKNQTITMLIVLTLISLSY